MPIKNDIRAVRALVNDLSEAKSTTNKNSTKKVGKPAKRPAVKTPTPEERAQAAYSLLNGAVTKVGGRLKAEGPPEKSSGGWYISFEPAYRQRLDHYGTSYDDEDEGQEGWDDDGWEEDYAGPLRSEVERKLKSAEIPGVDVDVGEKGHLELFVHG